MIFNATISSGLSVFGKPGEQYLEDDHSISRVGFELLTRHKTGKPIQISPSPYLGREVTINLSVQQLRFSMR
jgi:hypothetical protein